MKAIWLLTILFLACGTAHGQSLRVLPVQVPGDRGFPAAIQFYCTEKYSRNACQNDIFILRQTLGHYPLEGLGRWCFVLASVEEWDAAINQLHLPPESPAFSSLNANLTVIAQTVFSGPIDRRAELMKRFRAPLAELLNIAISHELGHVLCRELDEGKAEIYGQEVRRGKYPTCGRAESRPVIVAYEGALTTLSITSFLNIETQVASADGAPSRASEPTHENQH